MMHGLSEIAAATAWPLFALIALILLIRPIRILVEVLGKRVDSVSFGKFSLQLAGAKLEAQPLNLEIRELDSSISPQSGPSKLSQAISQLRSGGKRDFILIDLGSKVDPRWLTSRLYILALLLAPSEQPGCFVFVDSDQEGHQHFIGVSSPDRVRWALARRYHWFELAAATAAVTALNSYTLDAQSGVFSDEQTAILIEQFLANIRKKNDPNDPDNPNFNLDKWIQRGSGEFEHARWIDAALLKRLLGSDLTSSRIVLEPNTFPDDYVNVLLRKTARFVAFVDPHENFVSLIDRLPVLNNLAGEIAKRDGSAAT